MYFVESVESVSRHHWKVIHLCMGLFVVIESMCYPYAFRDCQRETKQSQTNASAQQPKQDGITLIWNTVSSVRCVVLYIRALCRSLILSLFLSFVSLLLCIGADYVYEYLSIEQQNNWFDLLYDSHWECVPTLYITVLYIYIYIARSVWAYAYHT